MVVIALAALFSVACLLFAVRILRTGREAPQLEERAEETTHWVARVEHEQQQRPVETLRRAHRS